LLKIIKEYTYDRFKKDIKSWFLNGKLKLFVHGNFSEDQATQVKDDVINQTSIQPKRINSFEAYPALWFKGKYN
jgi:hypothetical protein